jgi:predicted Zn-ribbon and HTH transcriptional regulator
MAQTTNHLRDLLEKIKGDAERALALLPSGDELRSLGWKCTGCGHVKHFTRPVTAAVAERCPKCKGDSFESANSSGGYQRLQASSSKSR